MITAMRRCVSVVVAALLALLVGCDSGGDGSGEGAESGSNSAQVPDSYSVEGTGAVAFNGSGRARCITQGSKNRKEWQFNNAGGPYGLTLSFPDVTGNPDDADVTISKASAVEAQGKATVEQTKVAGSTTFTFTGTYSGNAGSGQVEGRGTCVERRDEARPGPTALDEDALLEAPDA